MTVVLACRGCCCGTNKHPHLDHDAQLKALAAVADVEVTRCLGPCRWSNVLAVIDTDSGTQTWFGKVLTPADTDAVTRWITSPDGRAVPAHLQRNPPMVDQVRAAQIVGMRTVRP